APHVSYAEEARIACSRKEKLVQQPRRLSCPPATAPGVELHPWRASRHALSVACRRLVQPRLVPPRPPSSLPVRSGEHPLHPPGTRRVLRLPRRAEAIHPSSPGPPAHCRSAS